MAQCQTPFYVSKKTGEKVPVPCGRCPHCVNRYASAWSFRLMQEEKQSTSAYFITLTYAGDHLTFTGNRFATLVKSDLQEFFKRLRYAQAGSAYSGIKYYAVGEYGSKNKRPHYHVILFNADIQHIDPAWQLGSIYYGDVGPASVGYCLKYLMKKGQIPMHQRDDRLPEFSMMSKGLGKNYLTDAMVTWHLDQIEDRLYCTTLDGHKITIPRYYKDKIFSDVYFENKDYADAIRRRAGFFARLRLLENEAKLQAEQGESYDHNKVQHDIASFIEMKTKSDMGRSL